MPDFQRRHIPALFVANTMGIGAIWPLWKPSAAIRAFGLPPRLQHSPDAQTIFPLYGSRATILGAAIWVFWLQGKYVALDTILGLFTYAGVVDGWVCWKAGARDKAWGRVLAGAIVGG